MFVGKFPAFDGASNQKFNGRCAASNGPLQNCPMQFELPRFDLCFFQLRWPQESGRQVDVEAHSHTVPAQVNRHGRGYLAFGTMLRDAMPHLQYEPIMIKWAIKLGLLH